LNEDEYLLTKNNITVDSVPIKDFKVYSQLKQRPNPKVLGIPVGLHIYNLADQEPDSTFQKWLMKRPKREDRLTRFLSKKQVEKLRRNYIGFNKWLQKSGDAPAIINDSDIEKSIDRINRYYASFGWFNVNTDYTIDNKKDKKASITYHVHRHSPYLVDSIAENISSPVVDSLFQASKHQSFIKKGKQYSANDFVNERDRITHQLRNSGLYYFDQDYVGFEADTVNTGHKANITYIIPDREYRINDSTYSEPFKIHRINEVRIITDYAYENKDMAISDSVTYKNYKLFSYDELQFRPKAITDAISIAPNSIFNDIDRTLTYNQISDLQIFKYPNISYMEDPNDSTGTGLITTILLSPRKKYTLGLDFDAYTSTIQQFGVGFSTSFLIRNVFRGAETLKITAKGSIGSSKDAADSESSFFNISDIGSDASLTFPRILFPINTEKLIPKYMSPYTTLKVGFNVQNNIGLDRQNINSTFRYRWKPSKIRTNQLDFMNVQFVRNLNTDNYFRVYKSSYNRLNEIAIESGFDFNDGSENPELEIPEEAAEFIDLATDPDQTELVLTEDQVKEVSAIEERQIRLSDDNLIFATNFTWQRDSRENIDDREFSRLRFKLESAGNLLRGIAKTANLEIDSNGNYRIMGVSFSQYIKFEGEYIRHWSFNQNNKLAIRAFSGIAIPYGNSNSVPFTRSYFAGGSNDNRGWQPYKLGPGSSGAIYDFNEANFKIALNAEYRFKILGSFNGAFFIDSGNIWNVMDDIEDSASRFDGIEDIKEMAIASGFGLRVDFSFVVARLDIGFKTHNPARPVGERWFKEYNFSNAVYNIGVNYPF
jgi:outer membrane protein assembly factor BamA